MYGPFLGMACNGFIPLCISVNLNNMYAIKTKWGESIANNYSNVLTMFVLVWFPLTMLYVIVAAHEKRRNDEDFKGKYKFLLSGIKTKTALSRSYYLFFVLRRFALIMTGLRLFYLPFI